MKKILNKIGNSVRKIRNNIEEIKTKKGTLDYYIGVSDFLYTGKRVLNVALMAMAIHWLLYTYINYIPFEMKQNELFNIGYMIGVIMIPFYYVFVYLAEVFEE